MIKLYQYSHLDTNVKHEIKFDITLFPDKTSQVWRLNPEPKATYLQKSPDGGPFDNLIMDRFEIVWKFESEAEVMHILQLGLLLKNYNGYRTYLSIRTCPYARQDRAIANNTTFAFYAFSDVLIACNYFDSVDVLDVHNKKVLPRLMINILPNQRIAEVLLDSKADVICFPDKGASERGYSYDMEKYGEPIILDKKRNQESGVIEGLKFASKIPLNLKGFKILIVDDLCDGGRTFIESAKLLKENGAEKVFLYTTHGLYTHANGVNHLLDNGLDAVYSYDEVYVNNK